MTTEASVFTMEDLFDARLFDAALLAFARELARKNAPLFPEYGEGDMEESARTLAVEAIGLFVRLVKQDAPLWFNRSPALLKLN
jgi:hypothetical protein